MDTDRCKKLVATIQQLEQTELQELFKMLHTNGCKYTTNNHGVFINLSWLNDDTLKKIETYVAFCTRSRNEVQKYESLCDVLNSGIKTKQVKPSPPPTTVTGFVETEKQTSDKKAASTKVSSSMKFYLLKKRFAKQSVLSTTLKNDLAHEDI